MTVMVETLLAHILVTSEHRSQALVANDSSMIVKGNTRTLDIAEIVIGTIVDASISMVTSIPIIHAES